ncbi:hypothetical protein MNBD_ACTINO01-1632, partial [hydrothermal vent metagenome]
SRKEPPSCGPSEGSPVRTHRAEVSRTTRFAPDTASSSRSPCPRRYLPPSRPPFRGDKRVFEQGGTASPRARHGKDPGTSESSSEGGPRARPIPSVPPSGGTSESSSEGGPRAREPGTAKTDHRFLPFAPASSPTVLLRYPPASLLRRSAVPLERGTEGPDVVYRIHASVNTLKPLELQV